MASRQCTSSSCPGPPEHHLNGWPLLRTNRCGPAAPRARRAARQLRRTFDDHLGGALAAFVPVLRMTIAGMHVHVLTRHSCPARGSTRCIGWPRPGAASGAFHLLHLRDGVIAGAFRPGDRHAEGTAVSFGRREFARHRLEQRERWRRARPASSCRTTTGADGGRAALRQRARESSWRR